MRADEAHAYLETLAPSTVRMGLDRIRAALTRLGNPESSFPSIHVAGTNGKGSTCAFLSSCLSTKYRVGFYSSPHLVRVNERFRLNGVEIEDDTLAQRVTELLERLGPDHELTYFEFGTALAFWHFAQERVDVAVIETGLGGRLDATVLCKPVVTAITSIGFDHMEMLGSTLPLIAKEKAGIAKPGVPLVVARQPVEVMAVFEAAGVPLIVEGKDVSFDTSPFSTLELPLPGSHQRVNAGVALGVLTQLTALPLSESQLREGLLATRWPGRFEIIDGPRTLVLDGAHNPAGVETLVDAIDRHLSGRPLRLVFGVFADKDSEPMMRRLFPKVGAIHLAALHSPRSRAPSTYVEFAKTLCADVTSHASVSESLNAALSSASRDEVIVVAGSLHLIGEARAVLERSFNGLVAALDTFVPGDDPEANMRGLSAMLETGWPALDAARFRSAFFALLERFPDAEFGTPGPLVHAIERVAGYENDLRESLIRQPTFLSVSMANRFMNLVNAPSVLDDWEGVLERVVTNSSAPDWVQRAAQRYVEHQRDRRAAV